MRTPETRLHGQGNSLLLGLTLEAIASNVRPAEKRAKTINQLMMMMMMMMMMITIMIIITIIIIIIKHFLLTISFVIVLFFVKDLFGKLAVEIFQTLHFRERNFSHWIG